MKNQFKLDGVPGAEAVKSPTLKDIALEIGKIDLERGVDIIERMVSSVGFLPMHYRELFGEDLYWDIIEYLSKYSKRPQMYKDILDEQTSK